MHYQKYNNIKSLLLISYHTLQWFSWTYRLRYRNDVSSVGTDFTHSVCMVNGFCNAERILVFEQSPLDSSRMQFRAPYRIDCHKLVGRFGFPIPRAFHYFSRHTRVHNCGYLLMARPCGFAGFNIIKCSDTRCHCETLYVWHVLFFVREQSSN